jgi:hypothetical protein
MLFSFMLAFAESREESLSFCLLEFQKHREEY